MKEAREIRVNDNDGNTLFYTDLNTSMLIEAKSLKITNGDGKVVLNINDQGDVQKCFTPYVASSSVIFNESQDIRGEDCLDSRIQLADNKVSAIETDTNSQLLRCLYTKVDMVTMTLLKLENDIKAERTHLLDKGCSVDLVTDEDFFAPLLKLHEEVTELIIRLENYIKWDLNIDKMYGDLDIPSVDEVPDDKKEIVQKLHDRVADIKAYIERERPKIATKINSLVTNLESIVSEYGLVASARIEIN